MGRIICELERIYGVRQGSNNLKGTNVTEHCAVTQKDLAKELGISVPTLSDVKTQESLAKELGISKV